MTITKIKITAGRTFKHPHEQYSNLRPEIMLEADLTPGEDAGAAARELQLKAEGLVEDHKQGMLRSINELYQLTQQQAEVRGLENELKRAQERLNQIRQENPALNPPVAFPRDPAPERET